MAWEWVAPTATGVVGVAGIAGTWLGSHGQTEAQKQLLDRQQREQRRKELRAERRHAYAQFLAELHRLDYEAVVMSLGGGAARLDGTDEVARLRSEARTSEERIGSLYRLQAEVSLVCSSTVDRAMRHAVSASIEALATVVEGRAEGPLKQLEEALRTVTTVMVADLHSDTDTPP